jgi:hypothetical protein
MIYPVHCKKGYRFSVPSRQVTNQTLPGRELFKSSRPGRVWLVTSQLVTGKPITFFRVYTAIRFISISAKFGICTVIGLNETLVEAKIRTWDT